MDEFRLAAGRVHDATSYHTIFSYPDDQHIKTTYRQLARIVHPDRVSSAQQAEATVVFDKLTRLHRAAQQAAANDDFHSAVSTVVFESRVMRHETARSLAEYFDMTAGYQANSHTSTGLVVSVIKVARIPIDNELLAAEADALRVLADTGDGHAVFYPTLLDSFVISDGPKRLRANAITRLDGFVNLEEVHRRYPDGLHPLDMTWMWRRILWALGGAHEVGLLHGALVPSNIMIHPSLHGMVLVDWCYSVRRIGDVYPSLKAVVGKRRDWYLDGILKRQAPTIAHDIVLAARSMQFLMTGATVPRQMEQYFTRAAGGDVHDSAYDLLAQFDTLLERLGAPYYPRSYRPLNW